MTVTWISLIMVIGMLALMLAGLELAISMGLMSIIGLFVLVDKPIDTLAFTAFEVMNSFTLTAVPLFVFMGAIFFNTGVVRKLFDGIEKLVSFLPGGIAHSVILANAVFGAMSGSSVAATALFGKICYPHMERLGYSESLSLGVIVSAGTIAVLIPPSIILIIYGGWENVSVARLFAGGIIPGIILTLLFLLTIMIWVKIKPNHAPARVKYTIRERLIALKDVFAFLILIVLIMGVIFGGIMTPTEAAAMGAFLSILFALAYRSMSFKALKESMRAAVTITSMVALLIFTARVMGQVFQYAGTADIAAKFFLTLPGGKYVILTSIYILYILLGCFFDSFSMLVLTLPFISPVISSLGLSHVWFGVVYVALAEVGLITPPFGVNVFVLHGVIPKHSVHRIVYSALPFCTAFIVLLVLLTVFPDLVLWLPSILY